MRSLSAFSIPIRGLSQGQHEFHYTLDKAFFQAFEESPIQEGFFDLWVDLHKRSNLLEWRFEFDGFMHTKCDRCLTDIDLPVFGEHRLLVKYGEEIDGDSKDGEIVFIAPESSHFQTAPYVYEFIVLSLPIVNKCDDVGEQEFIECEERMQDYLGLKEDEDIKSSSSVWDQLKNITNN